MDTHFPLKRDLQACLICDSETSLKTMDQVVNEDQKGFITDRFIRENIRSSYDISNLYILHETKNQNIPDLLLSIDVQQTMIQSHGNSFPKR